MNPRPLHQKTFENPFVENLPGDPRQDPGIRRVEKACYSEVTPESASSPRLVVCSTELMEELGLSSFDTRDVAILTGNETAETSRPYAACYGGHQFGHWAGQLGDGRAISLGNLRDTKNVPIELQLKGAGSTPYSRRGDGRAVLRSSIREFLCSEAMHFLGVPTTRALSLALTGDSVIRDMFYDGSIEDEPSAIVCRTAPNFIRLGNFEILAHNDDLETLRSLYHYTLKTAFPELGTPESVAPKVFLNAVSQRTAHLIAHWMRVGFVHGVMNTDNLSISGLTIDYGPYGWLEDYDPMWTPNTTDAQSLRYCYGRQPHIGLWNLSRFAMALMPLGLKDSEAEDSLRLYQRTFRQTFESMFYAKLGLEPADSDTDAQLLESLLKILEDTEADMTIFFRELAGVHPENTSIAEDIETLKPAWYTSMDAILPRLKDWLKNYRDRLNQQPLTREESRTRMLRVNPKYVLRNYLVQTAIEEAHANRYEKLHELMQLIKNPYDEQPHMQHYYARRPEWARNKAGCSALSCSS